MSRLSQIANRFLGGHRRKAVILTAASAIVSRGMNFVILLAVVPLTLPLLGRERFGVLMTILGYGVLFSFVDLGIGSALIRETARSRVLDRRERLAELVISGLLLMALLGGTASAVLVVLVRWVPLDAVFLHLPAEYMIETRRAINTFALLFGVALPLQGLQKIYQGFQQAYKTYAASTALSVVALCAVRFLPTEHLSMPAIVFWVYGVPALAPLLFLRNFWTVHLRGVRMQWSTTRAHARHLLRAGSLYLLLQVAYVIGWSIDGSISSAMLGATAAGTLAVVQRLFQLVTVPLAVMNAPLWPAYADAAAHEDRDFLRYTLFRSMAFTLVTAASLGLLIYVLRDRIVDLWLGRQLSINATLVALAALLAVLEATGNAFAMYLNGLHVVKPQLVVAAAFMVLSVPIKFAFVLSFGLEGLVASTVFCYLLCVVLPYGTFFRHNAFAHVRKAPLHAA